MTSILMVCLGNICRSPLAEGILKSKLDTSFFYVDSAGTTSSHQGNPPDKRSIAIAKKNQIDISNQTSRPFIVEDFDAFDCIYVMDNSNYKNVCSLARNEEDRNKVHLILDSIYPGEQMEVPDPYYGGELGFSNVFQMLNEACFIIANNYNGKR